MQRRLFQILAMDNKIAKQLNTSEERECGYYSNRKSRESYLVSNSSVSSDEQETLLNSGFRRYANLYYVHNCRNCSECTSYRLPLDGFRFSKSQKKILKRNFLKLFQVTTPNCTIEKEELYLRYQYSQHFQKKLPGKFRSTEEFNPDEILDNMYYQMYSNPSSSVELEVKNKEGKVSAFAIFDVAKESLSAVYSVYDPKDARDSPGILNILKGIEWALQNKFKYFHLGLYLEGHPKMNYKKKFGPAEILDKKSGHWKDF